MTRSFWWLWLAPYVLLSSYLGLAGRFGIVADPVGALRFVAAVWSWSAVADAMFLVGTVATGVAATLLALRKQRVASLALALAGSWATYFLSYILLPTSQTRALGGAGLVQSLWFVAIWGVVGLAFATLAPLLVGRWLARRVAAEEGAASDVAA